MITFITEHGNEPWEAGIELKSLENLDGYSVWLFPVEEKNVSHRLWVDYDISPKQLLKVLEENLGTEEVPDPQHLFALGDQRIEPRGMKVWDEGVSAMETFREEIQ